MTVPESPPTRVFPGILLSQFTDSARQQTAATLASAIIIASGRPYSIEQALEIVDDIRFAMYPTPQSSAYKEWEKTKLTRLKTIRS